MSNPPERPKPSIRLTDDGELWGLPDPDQVRLDQARQSWEQTVEAKKFSRLKSAHEEQMKKTLEQFDRLNQACGKRLFFELEETQREAREKNLICRDLYVDESGSPTKGILLMINRLGFYAVNVPVIRTGDQGYLPKHDEARSLVKLIAHDEKVAITTTSIGVYEDEVRFYVGGTVGANHTRLSYIYTSQNSEPCLRLTDQDEPLIQACLHHSWSVYQQEQEDLREVAAQETDTEFLQRQLDMTQRIANLLPQATPQPGPENNLRWWQKIFDKRKKRKNDQL